jgi:haloalkane dehalogenase
MSNKALIPSKFIEVYGSKMHYIEVGTGDPILFLHGVPTSSYIWRNIIPHLSSLGRCIAPDLIGFGQSDKPDITYSIFDHIKYIQKFIEVMNLKNTTLIMHGWGSVIGFHYAMNNENNCHALVFYEGFLRSSQVDDISLPYQEQLTSLQKQENIYDVSMNGIAFIDQMLPQQVMRQLSEEEMNYYRQPFLQEGSSKPILQYIKEASCLHDSGKINQLIYNYSNQLTHSMLPKLMLYSLPGFITTIASAMWAKEHLPNLEVADVGEELHLAQESHPELIGETISAWLQGIEQMGAS